MTEQDRYIPGVPCWVDTAHPDPEAATAFYGGLFGWTFEDVMPPDAPVRYFIASLPGGQVGAIGGQMPDAAQEQAPAWSTYVWVDDADATTAKARAAGGKVLAEPMDVFDAGRMAVLADPEGAAISVWQPKSNRGAAVVNEHGSVNFNTLNSRDLSAAEGFYGAVFGWELLTVGEGAMWALPAYGDFLEKRTPGMRKGMADMGAPPRFEETVAAAFAIPDDQPDMPAHWGVTFAVDDADAIAARAAELGGTVAVEPFDAPWVRMAVIVDPQGAVFTASKFVPENKAL